MESSTVVQKVSCAACGAPIELPPDIDQFNCAYCGTGLVVQRGDGYVALKLAEHVTRAVEAEGVKTQSTIREESAATRSQLKQLELRQDLLAAQTQLLSVQAEIRALDRQRHLRGRDRRQLRALRSQQQTLQAEVERLQRALAPEPPAAETSAPGPRIQWSTPAFVAAAAVFFSCLLVTSVTALIVFAANSQACSSAFGVLIMLFVLVAVSKLRRGRWHGRRWHSHGWRGRHHAHW